MQDQKRGLMDQSKLSKIINDSQSRRNRQVTKPQNLHPKSKDPRSAQKQLSSTQSHDVLASHQNDDQVSLQITSELNSEKSQSANQTNQRKIIDKSQSRLQQSSAEKNFNSTMTLNKRSSTNLSSMKKPGVNYIERNKRELEAIKAKAQQMNRPVTQIDNNDVQIANLNKKGTAKVNSNLSRSKSAIGRVTRQKTLQDKAYRLDMSPEERLKDDLRRKVTDDTKSGIKNQVDNKYAHLEKMLTLNLGDRVESEQDEQQSVSDQQIKTSATELQYQSISSTKVVQSKKPQTSTIQKITRKKSQPPAYKMFDPNSTINQVKTSKGLESKPIAQKKLSNKDLIAEKSMTLQKKAQTFKQTKDQSGYSPDKSLLYTKNQTPTSNKKQPIVPKLKISNDTQHSLVKPIDNPDKKRGFIECDVIETYQNQSPEQYKVPPNDELDLGSTGNRSQNVDYKLQSKEDYLNFSIEKIWKEMEEIGRSKKAAQDLFEAFQNQYYDKEATQFYNQGDCSPTKRLISMKNATSKHQIVQHKSGMKQDGKYSLRYTTCPEKSYIVKPEDGKINYDEYKDKHAHKFVEKVINGKIEKIEIIEDNQLPSSPVRRSITTKSPVKIIKEQCKRGSMVRNSVNMSVIRAENEEDEILNLQVQEDVDEGPEIQINMDTEDYEQSEDGYSVSNQESVNGRKLLIQGRM